MSMQQFGENIYQGWTDQPALMSLFNNPNPNMARMGQAMAQSRAQSNRDADRTAAFRTQYAQRMQDRESHRRRQQMFENNVKAMFDLFGGGGGGGPTSLAGALGGRR